LKIKQEDIIQVNSDDGRYYELEINGTIHKLVSVTTVIGTLLNKPALVPWAYNVGIEETVKALKEKIEFYVENDMPIDAETILSVNWEDVKKYLAEKERSYDKRRGEGADRGILLHSCLEARIAGEDLPEGHEQVSDYLASLDKFIKDYDPEFHESEMKVVSLQHGFAGTLDTVCTIHKHPPRRRHPSMVNKRVVLDLKTNKSGSIYAIPHFSQLDAYGIAYEEMGGQYDAGMVVAIGPENYSPNVNYYPKGTFLKLLEAHRALEIGNESNPNARKKKNA
jgi:hypothetical protein